MTKILQLRRGNRALNDNFVGMPGEVSFDTDTKTIRVHDGATIGGIELAKADLSNVSEVGNDKNSTGFDISDVPVEFWDSLFSSRTGYIDSMASPVMNVPFIETSFGNIPGPKYIESILVCVEPEAGYDVGEVVTAFGIGTRANPRPNTYTRSNHFFACLFVGSEAFWVSHKHTGVATNITNSKWSLKFRAWR